MIAVSPVDPSEPSRVERAVTLQGVPVGEGIKDGPEDVRVEHGGPDSIMVHWTVPQVGRALCIYVCVCVLTNSLTIKCTTQSLDCVSLY